MTSKKRYEAKVLNVKELSQDLDELWTELDDPESELSLEARAANIDVEQLRGLNRRDVLEVREEGRGMSELAGAIIVAVTPKVIEGVGKLAMMLWEKVLERRIRQKRGKSGLKEKRPRK
jgi:hypothetical protein